jgi:nicotinamide-nucleotide amidase
MKLTQDRLFKIAHTLGEYLKARNLMLATAESCTGGWVSEVITSIPGSSMWFERGFVTYSDIAKQEMLGVSSNALDYHGAASEETVRQMAKGALAHSHAQISIAITGIAGPSGATLSKPLGTVWIAWAGKTWITRAQRFQFKGDRHSIRMQSVQCALEGLLHQLEAKL